MPEFTKDTIEAYRDLLHMVLEDEETASSYDPQVKTIIASLSAINDGDRVALDEDHSSLTGIIKAALANLATVTAPSEAVKQARQLSHELKVISYSAGLELDYGFKADGVPLAYSLYDYLTAKREKFTDRHLTKIIDDARFLCLDHPSSDDLSKEIQTPLASLRDKRGSSLYAPIHPAIDTLRTEISSIVTAGATELIHLTKAGVAAKPPPLSATTASHAEKETTAHEADTIRAPSASEHITSATIPARAGAGADPTPSTEAPRVAPAVTNWLSNLDSFAKATWKAICGDTTSHAPIAPSTGPTSVSKAATAALPASTGAAGTSAKAPAVSAADIELGSISRRPAVTSLANAVDPTRGSGRGAATTGSLNNSAEDDEGEGTKPHSG